MFVVEDTENNKFGYYLNTEIIEKYDDWIPTDKDSFTFSLKSNNRLNGMMKFEQKDTKYGYYIYSNENGNLAYPGYDFWLAIKGRPNCIGTRHDPSITEFHGTTNPLTGRTGVFGLKRFVVIQMK